MALKHTMTQQQTPPRERGKRLSRVRTLFSGGAVLAAAILIALAVAAVIAHLQHASDQRRQGQVLLSRLDQKLYQLQALEREISDDPGLLAGVGQQVGVLDNELDQFETQLLKIEADSRSMLRVCRCLTTYRAAMNEEMRLFRAGQTPQGRQVVESRVEPASEALAEAVQRTNQEFDRGAVAATQEADIGTRAILVLAALLLCLLFWRFERVQRLSIRLSTEKDTLRQSEERFRALIRNASEVIAIITPEGNIRYLSSSAVPLWGDGAESLEGTSVFALMYPDEVERSRTLVAQSCADSGGGLTAELRLRYADGSWRWSEIIMANLLTEPGIEGIVLTCRDITERRAFEEQLAHQAFHDALTGLPNRALFNERLRHVLSRADRRKMTTSVIFLDLDNFKVVNDSLGHEAGDRLLVIIAERLQACVRPGDTVGRQGGDEFTILLEEVDGEKEVMAVSGRIAEALRAPVVVGGREVFVTGSLGVAISSGDYLTPADLLRDADTAMYQAKMSGKAHCVIFDHDMNARAVERLELETDLRRAVENGEFRVYYQPIVLLDSGRIDGVEALVRWQHPSKGLIPPATFIPLAEETGLIVPLGEWVLRESCRQARDWQRQYPEEYDMTISVNLSGRQLQQPDLVEQVAHILSETGLDAAHLKLEITESLMLQDPEATIGKLHQLKALGIRLAMDDFGTGYSSMSYLSSLPLHTLKIDRSFVDKMGKHDEDFAIVRAILTLAKTLNLQTTGEGIETSEQLAQLRALGCDLGQGYLFARPLPAEGLRALLAAAPTGVDAVAGRALAAAQHLPIAA